MKLEDVVCLESSCSNRDIKTHYYTLDRAERLGVYSRLTSCMYYYECSDQVQIQLCLKNQAVFPAESIYDKSDRHKTVGWINPA